MLDLDTDCLNKYMKRVANGTFESEHISALCKLALKNIERSREKLFEKKVNQYILDNTKTSCGWFGLVKQKTVVPSKEEAITSLKSSDCMGFNEYEECMVYTYRSICERIEAVQSLANAPKSLDSINLDAETYYYIDQWANHYK